MVSTLVINPAKVLVDHFISFSLLQAGGPGDGNVGIPSGEHKASGDVDSFLLHMDKHHYATFQECWWVNKSLFSV